ncbi:hypothetical protein J6590_015918 [Homalodisca vitripennis]|nr:hypothetical protein J6590_015918 [Homalodisca vitripennis]
MQLLVFIIVGLLTQYCVRADSVKMISVIIAAYSLYLRVIDLLSTPSPPPCPLSRSSSFTSSTVSWGSVSSGWEFFWDSESESESGYSTQEEEKEDDLRGGGWNGWREVRRTDGLVHTCAVVVIGMHSCIRSVTMCCNEIMLAYTRESSHRS